MTHKHQYQAILEQGYFYLIEMPSAGLRLVFVAVLFALFQQGTCVKCYQCSTNVTWQCGERFDETAVGITDCLDDIGCQKVKHPTVGGGVEPISRGCYDATLCTKLSVCFNCKKDLCNSSVSLVPSFAITLVVGLICARYYLQ